MIKSTLFCTNKNKQELHKHEVQELKKLTWNCVRRGDAQHNEEVSYEKLFDV